MDGRRAGPALRPTDDDEHETKDGFVHQRALDSPRSSTKVLFYSLETHCDAKEFTNLLCEKLGAV